MLWAKVLSQRLAVSSRARLFFPKIVVGGIATAGICSAAQIDAMSMDPPDAPTTTTSKICIVGAVGGAILIAAAAGYHLKATEPKYDCVVVAGTFDRLHAGHKVLLGTAARSSSRKVSCACHNCGSIPP